MLFDVVGAERTLLLHGADRVERRVVAADAGIELERDAHRLPDLAEAAMSSSSSKRSVERENVVQKPPYSLSKHVHDAGEARVGEQRAVEAALRRAAGVHALHHRAVLRGHQARGLRAGDAQRMHGFVDIELQARARRRPRRKTRRRVAPECQPCADVLGSHAHADARPDLVARDGGGEKFLAAHARPQLGDRRSARAAPPRRRAARPARCTSSSSKPCTCVPLTSAACGAESVCVVPHTAQACVVSSSPSVSCRMRHHSRSRAVERAAERVEHQELDALAHLGGNVLVAQPGDEFGDAAGVTVIVAGFVGGHRLVLLQKMLKKRREF